MIGDNLFTLEKANEDAARIDEQLATEGIFVERGKTVAPKYRGRKKNMRYAEIAKSLGSGDSVMCTSDKVAEMIRSELKAMNMNTWINSETRGSRKVFRVNKGEGEYTPRCKAGFKRNRRIMQSSVNHIREK